MDRPADAGKPIVGDGGKAKEWAVKIEWMAQVDGELVDRCQL